MHRSGTSAVAGCLQRLGVDFGPRLMPATEDNPRGYYEHIDLVNLHDRLLLALGRGWDDTFSVSAAGWRKARLPVATARNPSASCGAIFPAAPLWGLKDPRLCRLLPWWEPLWREMDSEPLFVIVRRPPAGSGGLAGPAGRIFRREILPALAPARARSRTPHAAGIRASSSISKRFLPIGAARSNPCRRFGQPWPTPRAVEQARRGQFVDPALRRSAKGTGSAGTTPRLGRTGRRRRLQQAWQAGRKRCVVNSTPSRVPARRATALYSAADSR